jgi:hypothetical protein
MSDLGSNSLWSDIAGGAPTAQTDLMGPSYSYTDNIPGPSSMGIGTEGTFSQLGSNLGGIGNYVSVMIDGDPPLGNQFFVNTGGTCTAPDGSSQSRYNYINNKPSGAGLLPASMSEIGSGSNGLIPGVIGDIEGLNPMYMMNALMADTSPKCECYKCDVTTGASSRFLTTSLSPDYSSTACTQVDPSQCTTESFENQYDYSPIPTFIAVGVLVFMLLLK